MSGNNIESKRPMHRCKCKETPFHRQIPREKWAQCTRLTRRTSLCLDCYIEHRFAGFGNKPQTIRTGTSLGMAPPNRSHA